MRVARIGRELDLLDPTTIGHTVDKGHTTATSHDTSLEDTEKQSEVGKQVSVTTLEPTCQALCLRQIFSKI